MLNTQADRNFVECLTLKGRYWSLNLTHCRLLEIGSHSGSSFNKVKDKGRASMNIVFDLDTDPTYKDTAEKAVVVVSPLNSFISDQMDHRKSLKSAKK